VEALDCFFDGYIFRDVWCSCFELHKFLIVLS
jgi:hypothetical protein